MNFAPSLRYNRLCACQQTALVALRGGSCVVAIVGMGIVSAIGNNITDVLASQARSLGHRAHPRAQSLSSAVPWVAGSKISPPLMSQSGICARWGGALNSRRMPLNKP